MTADHNCEQAGYQLGTPQYADCRMELARRADANAAAMGLLSTGTGSSKPQQAPVRARIVGYTSIVCGCQQERRSTASTSLGQRTLEGCFCWPNRGIKLLCGRFRATVDVFDSIAALGDWRPTRYGRFSTRRLRPPKRHSTLKRRPLGAPSAPPDRRGGPAGKQSAAR